MSILDYKFSFLFLHIFVTFKVDPISDIYSRVTFSCGHLCLWKVVFSNLPTMCTLLSTADTVLSENKKTVRDRGNWWRANKGHVSLALLELLSISRPEV